MQFTIHWTMVACLIGLGWVSGIMSVIAFSYLASRWLNEGLAELGSLEHGWGGK